MWLLVADKVAAIDQNTDAIVLVNSASARYLDFRNYIQPYLDHFGVPYSVLDIQTNQVTTNIASHALIIIGHGQLDTNSVYLSGAEQTNMIDAVEGGAGMVNFDADLPVIGITNYPFVRKLFQLGLTNNAIGAGITFPPINATGQLHFITSSHATNETISLRGNLPLAGFVLPTNATAIVLSSGKPLLVVTKPGQGRAVQWAGYDWMGTGVKGPVAGLDDLVWRSLVWAARKPFVIRGMPNLVTLRVDDVAGPLWWAQTAIDCGFKPWMGLFFSCITSNDATVIRGMVTNGLANASIHSWGCTATGLGREWFFWNHSGLTNWPDAQLTNDFLTGLQWHQSRGIPISKFVVPHYAEFGYNAFYGLKTWGVEYISMRNDPGGQENALWFVGGPFRLYEPRSGGATNFPVFYADFCKVPGYPELDGQFFNCVTEMRDLSDCKEWCPDSNVVSTVTRGTQMLKRAFDSMALGTIFTHEWYIHPTADKPYMTPISSNNWALILQGITNAISIYKPRYVTMDYACQYVRATRTARIASANFDISTGKLTVGMNGKADLNLDLQIYTGADNSITNIGGAIPVFTNSATVSFQVQPSPPIPPLLNATLSGGKLSLSFAATSGAIYGIERLNGFGGNPWIPWTNITATGTNVEVQDVISSTQKFYRAFRYP